MEKTKKIAPEKTVVKKSSKPIKLDGLQLDIFDNEVKSVGKKELEERIWTRPLHKELISRMVVVENAGKRQATSKTKTRGEVSGGGKKPWKQKGTGRARVGSNRSPIWRGGGITFGPTGKQNFSKKANKKEFASAFASALSCWRNHNRIALVRDFSFEKPSTKKWLEFAGKISPSVSKLSVPKIVFVFGENSDNLILSSANLRQHLFVAPQSLTISQILWSNLLVIFESALPALEKRLNL